ncbi:hypothetical protein M0R45_030993 [Rubus argutus]|uniref:Jacalin-type lectin domain-containing protein n=1 Tax=Rubus argutus TaxID=59490 RepID=A0AAW1WCZ4_RUBAR
MAQFFEEKKTVVSTLYGGRGGGHWDDGLYQSVRAINLCSGKCIDSIGVVYHKNEQIHAPAHGGRGGGLTTITLGPNEFIKTISGHYGMADWMSGRPVVIRSLKFQTNMKAYGPFGEELGSDRFTLIVKDGDKIIGFFGRSGEFLDAIGIHVETHP